MAVKEGLPLRATLEQNYPNPFNPSTTIRYTLPAKAHVSLTIFSLLGRPVAELVDREVAPGRHEAQFRAEGLSSGIYFYRLKAGTFLLTKTMAVLK